MRKYFNLIYEDRCKNPVIPDDKELFSIDEVYPGANLMYSIDMYFADQGKKVEKWDERNTLLYSKGKVFQDFLPCAIGWPVVSYKMKEVFESLHIHNVQFLPVIIRNKITGEENNNYFVLNILTMLENAIDLKRTEHEIDEDAEGKDAIWITDPKPKIFINVINQYDVFRVLENWPAVYLSERLVNEFKERRLTGFDFAEVITV